MKLKILLILSIVSMLFACEATQQFTINRAHSAYLKGDYNKCLIRLSKAESYAELSEIDNARLSFQRGQCLELAGRKEEAMAVYKNVVKKFPKTDYAAQAAALLQE